MSQSENRANFGNTPKLTPADLARSWLSHQRAQIYYQLNDQFFVQNSSREMLARLRQDDRRFARSYGRVLHQDQDTITHFARLEEKRRKKLTNIERQAEEAKGGKEFQGVTEVVCDIDEVMTLLREGSLREDQTWYSKWQVSDYRQKPERLILDCGDEPEYWRNYITPPVSMRIDSKEEGGYGISITDFRKPKVVTSIYRQDKEAMMGRQLKVDVNGKSARNYCVSVVIEEIPGGDIELRTQPRKEKVEFGQSHFDEVRALVRSMAKDIKQIALSETEQIISSEISFKLLPDGTHVIFAGHETLEDLASALIQAAYADSQPAFLAQRQFPQQDEISLNQARALFDQFRMDSRSSISSRFGGLIFYVQYAEGKHLDFGFKQLPDGSIQLIDKLGRPLSTSRAKTIFEETRRALEQSKKSSDQSVT